MKTLRFFGMALLALVLCVNFVACSDDDGNAPGDVLAGTVWKITSASEFEDNEMTGVEISFKSDGTFQMSRNGWTYSRWSLNGDVLTLTVGESAPDDFMKGTININGNTATYTYHWEDVNGDWENNENYIMTLQKL